MIRREHYPRGAAGPTEGPLVRLVLTGRDRLTAHDGAVTFTEVWVTIPNVQVTDGVTDEPMILSPHEGQGWYPVPTAAVHNEILRARAWCAALATPTREDHS